MARPAPPSDDGSPARLIATMVGIVGILLLGSLAWSAVGALVSAVGAAGSTFSSAVSPPSPPTLAPAAAATPSPVTLPVADAPTPTAPATSASTATLAAMPTPQVAATPTPQVAAAPTPQVAAAPTPQVAATPTAQVAATPTATARNPWVLLPQPEPGAKIAPGQVTVEARGRGDAPITAMRLELDGAALPTALEQRSESTWRGSASVKIAPGQHNARVTITDADGRTGSFRWSFTAAPAP